MIEVGSSLVQCGLFTKNIQSYFPQHSRNKQQEAVSLVIIPSLSSQHSAQKNLFLLASSQGHSTRASLAFCFSHIDTPLQNSAVFAVIS